MTAALILAFSSVALLQFFISYCRSVIAATGAHPLSDQVREAAGIQGSTIRGDEFSRLLQLTNLCPDSQDDYREIAAVSAYFRMLRFARGTLQRVLPGIVPWAEAELSGCAHFAAVTLDRRISHSRSLMAQQMSSHA